MDGEFGHPDLLHLLMLQELELEPARIPAYYSRKPLPVRSHRMLVQLTLSSFAPNSYGV